MNIKRAVPPEKVLKRAPNRDLFLESSAGYALLTLHRPSNVDDPGTLERLLKTFARVSGDLPLIFPIHPRTDARIKSAGLEQLINNSRIFCTPPLGYLEMLGLMRRAKLVLTDSGGIQEETTALGIPCITLRDNTERPITLDQGTNTIAGNDPAKILAAVADVMTTGGQAGRIPELWDGNASLRIKSILHDWLENKNPRFKKAISS